ncbi:hypothetical protein SAMN05444359_1186 [Neolewinella agarilytica]|uniref:Uncharacterized protein n=1 Tax=Neolewinella agarilytica TaxID=478744 RepID=A0A1H9JP35_9BACT|nr:hypothetical protein SAMN05444359_1186 [Neolewinella agarilytica]
MVLVTLKEGNDGFTLLFYDFCGRNYTGKTHNTIDEVF